MQPVTRLFVELAERMAARLGAPRVRALHLPPPGGSKEAEFCALELDEGSIGFTYIRLAGTEDSLRGRHGVRDLAGVDAVVLARGLASRDPVDRALGLAAVNALSQQLFARAGWLPPASDDPLGGVHPRRGEHIGMVGLFTPLLRGIEDAGARLTVLELKPSLVREEPNVRVTLDPAQLAGCAKVLSTCTVLLNDTLDEVLGACRGARHVALIGPTAGCVPDPLFARGIHVLGGRRVTDRTRFLEAFLRGGKWGDYADKYVLSREDYPGLEALLQRVH